MHLYRTLLAVCLCGLAALGEDTSDSLDPLDFSYREIWKHAQRQCNAKGVNNTVFVQHWLNVRTCFANKVNALELNQDSIRLDTTNQHAILSKHCPNLTQAVTCLDPFVEHVKGCVEQDTLDIFNALRGWFQDIIHFLCASNGTNFAYDRKLHDACTNELSNHIFLCAASNVANFTPDANRRNLTSEQCGEIYSAKECLLEKLKTCELFVAGAQMFYKNFIQITSCTNFL